MIAYKDCDYSLFVSYAHKDDSSEFNWVEALRDAIYMRLDKLDNDIVKKELHFSSENGPSGAALGSQLPERVARSFGMLLVVGEKYVESTWCERELQYFHETFGSEGFAGRLYIAAMTKDAITLAEQGEQWKLLMPTDQLWVPMYGDADPKRPLSHRTIDGSYGFPGAFMTQAAKIADRLIEEIERDHRRDQRQAREPAEQARTAPRGKRAPVGRGELPETTVPSPFTSHGITDLAVAAAASRDDTTGPVDRDALLGTKPTSVFVSHATTDREWVERNIIRPLQAAGVATWYAKESIITATRWEREIHKGLQSCDWFLLVVSPRSAESEWVQDELNWALTQRPLRVIPIIAEATDLWKFHIRLPRIQHLNFASGGQEARASLLAMLMKRED